MRGEEPPARGVPKPDAGPTAGPMVMPSPSRKLRALAVHSAFLGLLVFVGYQGRATGPGGTKAGSLGGSVSAARLHFTEVAHSVGIDFAHRVAQLDARLDHIAPQVAGTGAAVSVCDPNGDGWPDLYATSSADGAPNALFVNAGDGTFTDRAAAAGLADLNHAGQGLSLIHI